MDIMKRSPFRLIVFLVRCSQGIKYSRVILIVVIVAGIVSGACNTALLALLNRALSRIVTGEPLPILGFAALCILLPISRTTSEALLLRLVSGAIFEMRMRMCRRILGTPLRTLEEVGAHRLLATLTDDIPTITGALVSLPQLIMHFAIIVACFIYLAWLSKTLVAITIVFIVVGVVTYQIPLLKAIRTFRLAREEWDSLFKHYRGLTEGAKELKLNLRRREAFLSDSIAATAATLRQHNIRGGTLSTIANSWGQALFFVLIGIVVFVAPRFQTVDPHTLLGYTLALLYLMTPLQVVLNVVPNLSRAQIAINKIQSLGLSLGGQKPAEEISPADLPPLRSYKQVELVELTHTYHNEKDNSEFTLGPISLSFRPGEIVFLTGGNGSGKTTLAKLIAGLYSPESGHITVDGLRVTDDVREYYRQHFSMVFYDFYLFDTLLGIDLPNIDEVSKTYLERLQLDHKVKVENGVLSTTELSQGQRKRLALLTAYLEDRPFYIFDEWAADQDPHFRDIFYFQILPALKERGKTVLVISHDDRYYHLGDNVVRLEYGRLVSQEQNARAHDAVNNISVPAM